jgi:DHA1 family bicyclomycin/chloramphenicol resistance-like MFS transporter
LFPPALPWTVLPLTVYTIGLSLAVPNLTIFALDLFPHNRGLAASLQVFQGSMFNAIVAGAVAPYVAGSGLGLAATNAAFLICGAGCTFVYFRLPRVPEQRNE